MSNLINDIVNETPPIIDFPVEMNEANEVIEIYSGNFILKNKKIEAKIKGTLEYRWFPNMGTVFYGDWLSDSINVFKSDNSQDNYDLIIDGLTFGECFLTNRTIGGNREFPEIKGVITHRAVFGDGSINVDSVKFAIPNLKEYYGTLVHKTTEKTELISHSRIEFKNKEYTITIDKAIDYKKRFNNLKSKGGFILLYSGELKNKKGGFTLEKTKKIIDCLNTFLCFLNGSRISVVFYNGIFKGKNVWCDYSNYVIDSYKNNRSWTLMHSVEGYNELFNNFRRIWSNKEDRDFLTSVIHWYIEVNNNSGFVEGSIIMAQSALELIYNWLLIEKGGLLVGRDSENISASNKIRLLLSHLKIENKVPNSFNNLGTYVIRNPEIYDGPEAISQIRNAIVHSQFEKRKKITALPPKTKYEALQLCIWYIEMSLLFILEYKGKYTNRCSEKRYPKDREQNVPWSRL